MNYLLLVPGLVSIGGMQKRDRLLIRAMDSILHSHGGQMVVLSLNDPVTTPAPADLAGLRVTKILRFGGDRQQSIWTALRFFRQANLVLYGLLGFAPLVIFQRLFSPRSRRFLLMHGIEVWERRRGPYQWAVHQMNGVISISHYTLDRYRQAYQVPLSQTAFILPNSLDLVRTGQVSYLGTESFDGQAGSNPNALRLLTVARLVPKELGKGVDTVIRALPELLSGFPDLRYIVIGDGSDRTRLEHLAREMRVDHAVEFRGFVSETELEREYSNCAVYVMPSASEGFGLVFIEAMAHGKPVVAARVGGTPEVVQDGVTGLLIDFGDVTALTQSVKRLLEDADLRLRMGQASLQRVRENYTYDIFCQRVAQILSEISRIQI